MNGPPTSPPPRPWAPACRSPSPRSRPGQAGGLFRLAADLITAPADDACGPGQSRYVVARPAGVAGLITPWRTPFLAQARAVAPALAAGCTIVLKPDEWAPLPAALLAEIAIAAGLPDGVLNIVHGSLHRQSPRRPGAGRPDRPPERGAAVVRRRPRHRTADHARRRHAPQAAVDSTGRATRPASSSPTPTWIRRSTARCSVRSRSTGQRRTATSTILAQRPVYDLIVSRLAERAERIRVGDPADPATELGPLPDSGHVDALAGSRAARRPGGRAAW